MVDQPAHHLDGRPLRADDVTADRALHDLEVPDAPVDHALVELDQRLRELVQIFELAPARVDLDQREPGALVCRVERLAERFRDAPQLLESRRVEAAAVAEHLADLGVLPR